MIRLPNTEGTWEEHTHASGRIFLSNPATNETKWLWQKWDMKGRLFVRNIANPTHQIWVDQMDLAMRLKSGTASEEEVNRYVTGNFSPKLPPPPPSQPPPQHPHLPRRNQWQHPQPRRPPYFDHPEHPHPNQLPRQPPFHHPAAPPYQNDVNTHPHRQHPDPYLANRAAPDNPNFRPTDSLWDNRPPFEHPNTFHHPPGYPPNPQNHSQPKHQPPLPPSHREPHGFRVDPTHPNQSSAPLHHLNQRHNNHLDHRQKFPQNHPKSETRKDHHAKNKKRSHDFEANGQFRYWSAENKPGKKRSRTKNPDNKSKSSRFAPIPDACRPRSPRPTPSRPERKPLSGEVYGPFKPRNRAAQRILASCIVPDSLTIGLLHDRDFKNSLADDPSSPSSVFIATNGDDEEYSFEPVVGTCMDVEKDFLRLTSAPKPEAVRPPHVLVKALAHIKTRWREGAAEYDWVCRQLKSIRQDYKVQHVKDRHVVDVYETHARIALENNDLGEFNTCVAQVQELYRTLDCPQQVQDEFACYRILYNVLVKSSLWEQARILGRLTSAERGRPATRFALSVRRAVAAGNYRHYFKLCSNQPPRTMVSYLLIHLHDRVRFRAAAVMTASYGPGQPGTIPLRFVLNQLGWNEDEQPPELRRNVHPENVVRSDDTELLQGIRSLTPLQQPVWLLEAISFILGINIACVPNRESDRAFVDRVQIDFKATKAQGLRERKTKLITHAGSEDVKLMK